MEVVFILWSTGICGGVRAVFEFANRLCEKGVNVGIIALGGNHSWFDLKAKVDYVNVPTRTKFLMKLLRILTLHPSKPCQALNLEGLARRLGFHADLIKLLAENIPSADALIATYYPTSLALYLSQSVGTRFYFLQDFPELIMENDGVYGVKLFELTLRLPFIFLTNSSLTKDLVLKRQRDARVHVVGVGVNTKVFRPKNVREERKGNVVMTIIRGYSYKGSDLAIKALNLVKDKVDIKVVFVGKEDIVKKLRERLTIKFDYEVYENASDDELANLYSSADVFLYTSRIEAFGLPPLEAMACGTPVVTTDCLGVREYAVNGYNSLIVQTFNPEDIAEAVIRVLMDSDLRKKLIRGGLETARKWDWEVITNKFLNILRKYVGGE